MNIKYRTLSSLLIIGVLAGFLTGCGTTPSGEGGSENPGSEQRVFTNSDEIRVGDMLKISFRGPVSEIIQDHEERVSEQGMINLRQVGEIKAAGKNRVDLQKEIKALYVPEYYKYLTVTIAPDQRFFYVYGEVNKPDRHFYAGELTVLGAISTAGDFTDFANKGRVQLIRSDGSIEVIDCKEALKNPTLIDVEVLPGDRINVPRRIF